VRKLYNEFFYIPKHGKVREKVMLTRVAMTVVIMVMCLAAMSITAYAYFSYNITSGSNIIKSASFYTDVTVQITDADGKAVDNSQITPITSDHKKFRIEGLEVGKYYTVTITHTEQSTAQTGFVVVTADKCTETYHTQQLAKDVNAEGGQTPSISFKLMITDATNVHLLAHWGTSSYYDAYKEKGDQEELYITQGEEIRLIIDGNTEPKVNKESNEGSDDESKETGSTTPSTNTTTGTETPSTQTSESTTTPSTETSTPVETTPPETTGETESTNTTEPSSTTTEPATQTTEPASTETTAETQPATETTETTGTPTTEANE